MSVSVLAHYGKREVQQEIFEFLRGRWVGIEGQGKRWVRWSGDRPLAFNAPSDVYSAIVKHGLISPRSVYGTIEVFASLSSRSDVEERYAQNVVAATPFFDIDIEGPLDASLGAAVDVSLSIVEFLESWGLRESVYVLWSGNGFHVRIHERALGETPEGVSPVDAAWALVEYTLRALESKLYSVVSSCSGCVKVENIVNPKRVFTAPLSLHREKNRVAVALRPDDLTSFEVGWSTPSSYRHDKSAWRRHVPGEGRELVREALKKLGKAEGGHTKIAVENPRPPNPVVRAEGAAGQALPKIGRFQAMALLQAARYYVLRGDLERAKSWGLNRAIFYAWAKHYGAATRRLMAKVKEAYGHKASYSEGELSWDALGGERAQMSPRGFYVIGGVEQTPEDYEKSVVEKVAQAGFNYEELWRLAVQYVSKFPKKVLEDPQLFYKRVYEPVRDRLPEALRARG